MSKIDIVVFGATGFTGIRIVEYLAALSEEGKEKFTFALAGRDSKKLAALRKNITSKGLQEDAVPIIIADSSKPDSLDEMCAKAKILISAVGPFRLFGEPIVAAAVKAGIIYLDVTGEPGFMDLMAVKYHEQAQKTGAQIVHSCGFDSLPADMGVIFTAAQFSAQNATAASVESFLTPVTPKGYVGHYATWESAVMGLSDAKGLARVRKQLSEQRGSNAVPPPVGPKLKIHGGVFKDKRAPNNYYCMPFPGSDNAVVRNTQQLLNLAKTTNKQSVPQLPKYAAYFTVKTLRGLIGLFILGILLKLFTPFKLGRWLLLKFPRIFTAGMFSHAGPSKEQMDAATVLHDFFGRGYSAKASQALNTGTAGKPDLQIHTRITGPDPFYVTCGILIVQSALTALDSKQRALMPSQGGVFTPGALFYPTNLIDRLNKVGIKFEVVKTTNLA